MSRLYTPTDQTDQDGLHAEWGPFDNPANVNPPRVLHWHYWKSALAYHPFLVEVADVSEGEITFWILDRGFWIVVGSEIENPKSTIQNRKRP